MRAKKTGKYRSRLEQAVADQIKAKGFKFTYESRKIPFVQPAKKRSYLIDFQIEGVTWTLEVKGRLTSADRMKYLWVRQCNPEVDLRFLFGNAYNKIYKGSKTSYADWCDKHGFKWAHKIIPEEWYKEDGITQ